jgi:arginine repressor
MAKKTVNKSQEIRTILTATPKASAKEVVAALKEKGIAVSETYVYGVKKTMRAGKKKGPKPTVKVAAPVTAAAPSSNGQIGIGASIGIAKAAAAKVGGWAALKEIVDALQ